MKKLLSALAACIAISGTTNAMAEDGDKTLVAYFSATGTTAGVAQKLANATGGDLFEIVAEQPYTSEDLDWQNDQSRSAIEMNDRNTRPAISSNVEDMAQYKIVFIGFPIWWGREPSIIDTFVESYDFADKTIIPFATSGSSEIGDSGANIQSLAPNAHVLSGQRFSSDISEEDLKNWADTEMANQ
jgi:flavodoxin